MSGDPSDFDLLEAWQKGERPAGDQLFERHFRSLFRFFRNKVDDAVAEDLTQTCFLACVDGRERFRQHASFRTYLFSIARNQLYMFFRKKGRQEKVMDFASASVADLGASPGTLVAKKDEHKLLLKALRLIPVDFQIAVELYYWEGLSTKELAGVLAVPEGTVRSRLTRAREHLAKRIEEVAASPELAQTTMGDFENWAKSLRDAMD